MRITVVGLGKIGLPLAVQFACKGHQVIGTDVNPLVVQQVNLGQEPFPGEADLSSRLKLVVGAGLLRSSGDTTGAVRQSDVVVVVVPLLVGKDRSPDFGWMDAANADIARGLQTGTLVCYETTLPVGTTRTRWKPQLEELSGLTEGDDFHLVFSPERVLTGRIFADLRKYPKLIGGLTEQGAKQATAFYGAVLDFDERSDLKRPNGVWDVGSAEAAELAKLAETTYRDVNIALANEFAKFADRQGIDFHQVTEASNSQPYSHIHRPGIAVGGHCIPVYPQLYLWNDPGATVISAARSANESMPAYAVALARRKYGDLSGARVAVLGAAYRGGVKETACSGVFPTVDALNQAGAIVSVHDPMFTDEELRQLGFRPHALGAVVDVAIVQADHEMYKRLNMTDLPGIKVLVDGRRCITPTAFTDISLVVVGSGSP